MPVGRYCSERFDGVIDTAGRPAPIRHGLEDPVFFLDQAELRFHGNERNTLFDRQAKSIEDRFPLDDCQGLVVVDGREKAERVAGQRPLT